MKYIITLLMVASYATGAQWDDPALPMADPDKHVYQVDWGWMPPGDCWVGGSWSAKRIPSMADMKEKLKYEYEQRLQDENIKQIKRADNLMLFGLLGIIACAVAHGFSSLPQLQRVAEYGIVGGVVAILGGIGHKFLMKNEVALEWLFGVVMVLFVLYKVLTHDKIRDWSISHIFNRKG